jgi:hypothetical protein
MNPRETIMILTILILGLFVTNMIQFALVRYQVRQAYLDGWAKGRDLTTAHWLAERERERTEAQANRAQALIETARRREASAQAYEADQAQWRSEGLGWSTGKSNSQGDPE